MRRIVFLAVSAVAAATLAACSNETTAPLASSDQLSDFATSAFGTALTSAGGYDADLYRLRLLNGLPDELKLTAEQQAKIKALVDEYVASTKADREALTKILREAADAIKAHKSRADVKAILDQGIPIRARLIAAEAEFKSEVEAVLTPEQKAWIASHAPKRCDPSKFPPLSDAQKAQMKALEDAFVQTNKADLDAVKAALDQIKAALLSGKSRADVLAILDSIKPAIERLATARATLRTQLEAVLTPEQKASGCIPLG